MNRRERIWRSQVTIILLLLLAILPMPYGYYIFLRVACCVTFAYIGIRALDDSKTGTAYFLFGIAFLYNPIIRVHLNREAWQVINVITIGIATATIFYVRGEIVAPKKENPQLPGFNSSPQQAASSIKPAAPLLSSVKFERDSKPFPTLIVGSKQLFIPVPKRFSCALTTTDKIDDPVLFDLKLIYNKTKTQNIIKTFSLIDFTKTDFNTYDDSHFTAQKSILKKDYERTDYWKTTDRPLPAKLMQGEPKITICLDNRQCYLVLCEKTFRIIDKTIFNNIYSGVLFFKNRFFFVNLDCSYREHDGHETDVQPLKWVSKLISVNMP